MRTPVQQYILLTLSLLAPSTFAQDTHIESLRGLKGVRVTVEDLYPEAEGAGLTRSQLQTDAELKLRLAAIPILDSHGEPTLYINVNAIALQRSPNFAFSVDVDLFQNVILLRDLNILVAGAATWHSENLIGVVTRSQFVEVVRNGTRDLVDDFINAYLTANPKK